MDHSESQALLAQLELCGHFLHHRRGGKRGQTRILRILSEREGIAQRDLLAMLHIQSGSLSEVVGKLEAAGFLRRERCETDRRQVLLRITEEGRRQLARQEKETHEQEGRLFEALSAEEQRQLGALIGKLLEGWMARYDRSLFDHRGSGTARGDKNRA